MSDVSMSVLDSLVRTIRVQIGNVSTCSITSMLHVKFLLQKA
jgi:hypothetical protein